MTQSSAPGKIILFGEHAVVYGRPALAIPVTQIHADVEVSDSSRNGIWINAPDVNLHAELNTLPSDHPIASIIHNFLFLSRVSPFPNLEINISSTIPVASGLGSGAAVTVALTRALSSHFNYPMSEENINAFAYEIEKLYHGTPSGIDNTVVTYAKPVYFVKEQPIETFRVGKPFTIVIGDTGISAPTKESVSDVRRLWLSDKPRWESIFDKIAEISLTARRAIEQGHWELLGGLMNENHRLLQEMTVSSAALDKLVSAACKAGALGAKMSGGGRGGNMIALVEEKNTTVIAEALKVSGAMNTIVSLVR
jgi:mevalonate kinase